MPAIVAVNLLVHVFARRYALGADKAKGWLGSVVHAGSQAVRGIPNMGMAKPSLTDCSVDEFKTIPDSSAFAKQDMETLYGQS